jgi:hypothetical protein
MAKRIRRKNLTTHTTRAKMKTNRKMGTIIRSKGIIISIKMLGPYTRRRIRIVKTMNNRPKKGTKFRQLAPHRAMPTKAGQIRCQLQMKRDRDAKANKAIMGPNISAAPSTISIIMAVVLIYLYLKSLLIYHPFMRYTGSLASSPP